MSVLVFLDLWVALGKLFQIFGFLLICIQYGCISMPTSLGWENPYYLVRLSSWCACELVLEEVSIWISGLCSVDGHHLLKPWLEHKFEEADLPSSRGRLFLCLPAGAFLVQHSHTIYSRYFRLTLTHIRASTVFQFANVKVRTSHSPSSQDPYNPLVLFLWWSLAHMCEIAIEPTQFIGQYGDRESRCKAIPEQPLINSFLITLLVPYIFTLY